MIILLFILLIYVAFFRPYMLMWGATQEEVQTPFPCSGIVPGGKRGATMATTLHAPPSVVWCWLAQMGLDRGGWYSYDKLDNWGHVSADRIHPEWQTIELGQHLVNMPEGKGWWEVAALQPGKFLALRASVDLKGRTYDPHGPRPSSFSDSTWSFWLKEGPGGTTRLIVSGYWAMKPAWLKTIFNFLFLEPAHFIMQKRQFVNLERRVKREMTSPFVKGAAL